MHTTRFVGCFIVLLISVNTAYGLEVTKGTNGPAPKPTTPTVSSPFRTTPPRITPITNPLVQYFKDQCTEAKKLIGPCNLCQDAVKAAQDNCEKEKQQIQDTNTNTCATGAADAFNDGVQSGIAEIKNKTKNGYFLQGIAGTSCETFCSHIRADDGHLMMCIGSITTSGGCLSDVALQPGDCSRQGTDVYCMCI